jgi:hypothetical protein
MDASGRSQKQFTKEKEKPFTVRDNDNEVDTCRWLQSSIQRVIVRERPLPGKSSVVAW